MSNMNSPVIRLIKSYNRFENDFLLILIDSIQRIEFIESNYGMASMYSPSDSPEWHYDIQTTIKGKVFLEDRPPVEIIYPYEVAIAWASFNKNKDLVDYLAIERKAIADEFIKSLLYNLATFSERELLQEKELNYKFLVNRNYYRSFLTRISDVSNYRALFKIVLPINEYQDLFSLIGIKFTCQDFEEFPEASSLSLSVRDDSIVEYQIQAIGASDTRNITSWKAFVPEE